MGNYFGTFLTALSALFILGTPGAGRSATSAEVISPNGSIQLKVFLHEGRLAYTVSFKKQPVVATSPLGFAVDGVPLTEGVAFGKVKEYRVKETSPWRGVHSRAVNHCNGATVALHHAKSKTDYTLDIRAFNDGVAFRTIVPGDKGARVPD